MKTKKARIQIKSGNKKGKYHFYFDRIITAKEAALMLSILGDKK